MHRIGIFVEPALPPNVNKLLLNLGKMLHEDFTLDMIGKFSPTEKLLTYYDHKYYTGVEGAEGIQRIKQGYINCREYCLRNKPDALFQLIMYPINAPIVTFVGNDLNIPTAVRVPEDTFKEYQVRKFDLFERTKILMMNNVLGRYPLKSADKVMVLTEYLKKEMIKKGCPKEKIRIIPQPINTNKFSPVNKDKKNELRRKLDLQQDKKIALTIGRLNKTKGLDLLHEAVKKIEKTDLLFCLIGKGPYGKILKDKYPNKIIHPGFVPFEDIDKYYKASDLLIHPSSLEGLPNVVLEAEACNLPVLVKKANYTKTLDIPTFEDAEELVNLLDTDLQPTPLPEEYQWDNLKEKYIEFFKELINSDINKNNP